MQGLKVQLVVSFTNSVFEQKALKHHWRNGESVSVFVLTKRLENIVLKYVVKRYLLTRSFVIPVVFPVLALTRFTAASLKVAEHNMLKPWRSDVI